MTVLLIVPLLLPFALRPLSRRVLDRLAPATALWALTCAAVTLAGCSLAALGAFALTGLLKLPVFAVLGELVHPLHTASDLFAVPAAALSAGALAVSTWALVRWAVRQSRAFRTAQAEAGAHPTAGDLCIVDSPRPDAYALPGRPHRIVVTTAMLRSLSAAEREALFAHERAHNHGGHHYFLAAADLAAHCHPGLRTTREAIRLATERAADESAARVVGDRKLAARAIGRAALAARHTLAERPAFTPAAAAGPVPQRVAALMTAPRAPRTASWICLLLLACTAVSAGTAATGVLAFHHDVEVAQGEER
ncbi:M56 family metallopeptidase [Streptomyces niger]|uniref:M56 family metallopeptidase n=1 Tax=Streptomyces niger TaxID=66373 RepID=UPI00069C39B3|nr:M56 family metallopeptidase [Streptomyces niger]